MSRPVVDVIRHAATWFESSPDGFGPLLESIGDARLVLIGEASHGTHEFYRTPVVHIDETHALEPLEKRSAADDAEAAADLPETYPSGV